MKTFAAMNSLRNENITKKCSNDILKRVFIIRRKIRGRLPLSIFFSLFVNKCLRCMRNVKRESAREVNWSSIKRRGAKDIGEI